jgi:hypothetical protein
MTRVQFPVAEFFLLFFLFILVSLADSLLTYTQQGRVAQWIRRRSSEPKIVGSSPTVVILIIFTNPE